MQIMGYPSFDQIQETREKLFQQTYQHWRYHDLFSFNWWFLLVLAIVPWIIWWRLLDRKRAFEIFSYGLLVALTATILDSLGTNVVWWGYRDELLSFVPPLYPADVSAIVVPYMLVYQYCRSKPSFALGTIALSACFSFIGEPLFMWLGIYHSYSWRHIYSFAIYIAMAYVFRWFIHEIPRKSPS